MSFNPVETPYRVRIIYPTPAYGYYGWRDEVTCFATLEEARAFIDILPKYSQRVEIQLDIAINPETWQQNGTWKRLETSKR